MAPINYNLAPSPKPERHSLYRRDIQDGSLVSLIITVIILSILFAGACIYLFRLLWARFSRPQWDRRRLSGMSDKLADLEPYSETNKDQVSSDLPIDRKPTRPRSYSDELWSSQMDHETPEEDDSSTSTTTNTTANWPLARHSQNNRSSRRFRSATLTTQPLRMHPVQEHELEYCVIKNEHHSPRLGHARSKTGCEIQTSSAKLLPLRSHPVDATALLDYGGAVHGHAAKQRAARRTSVGRI